MHIRRQFLENVSWTSEIPAGFVPSHASGSYIYNHNQEAYLDLISGFSVNNLGHSHPAILEAIQMQAKKYLHTSVYGEHIQSPQLVLAELLLSLLPSKLNNVFFLNAGSETIDASIKLARKATGRSEIVACSGAYHGSTLSAEALRSDMEHSRFFRPLIPNIHFINANDFKSLDRITEKTAMVITEVVQAEAGVIRLSNAYLEQLRKKCTDTGTLLVFDEIQTGLGRTGSMFAFQQSTVIPDILLLGKALGSGLPLSALIASRELLSEFKNKPPLSYLSTFGGNPLSCAAGLAGLQILLQENLLSNVHEISAFIIKQLKDIPNIQLRACGLLIAIDFQNAAKVWHLIAELFKEKVLVESFLFRPQALRLAPPLNISKDEINSGLVHILQKIHQIQS